MSTSSFTKKRLYLFTNGFPSLPQEEPFISPELRSLEDDFDIILIAVVPSNNREKSNLPGDTKDFLLYATPEMALTNVSRFAFDALRAVFSRVMIRELIDLVSDGFSVGRLVDSLKMAIVAKDFQSFCRKHSVFDNSEDVVYYSFWFALPLLTLSFEKLTKPKMKVVARAHGYDLFNERQTHSRQPFQRVMRDTCDNIFFISEHGKSYFSAAFGPEKKLGQYVVNRLGVRSQQRSLTSWTVRGERLIVSCSNLIPLKRVSLIAEALAKLARPDIRWIHFGDGDELPKLRRYCESNQLRASLFGYAPNSEIISYYSRHLVTCFITTSSSEGLPVSIMEAESFGIPVIATDVGGISEMIDGNGVLLSPNPAVGEVAEAIDSICSLSQAEWEQLSRRSYAIWDEKYDANKNKQALRVEMMRLMNRK